MIDQATRNYVQSVVDSAPVRQGSIDSVIVRGRRRRSAMRIGTAASVAAVLLLAAGMTAWLRPVAQPVASGSDPVMLELPSGFAVGVEPETVESQGAIIYVGLRGPEPVFDTADLGSEIGIVRRPATDLIVPPSDDLLERNALHAAAMVYLGDLNGAQVALSISDGGFLALGGEELCIFFGNGTPITGGGDCSVADGPRTGESSDPPVGGWLVWTGLPEETAAVQMELSDGTSFWQRPAARTVYFNLSDGRTLRNANLTAMDSNGTAIQTATPEHTTPPGGSPATTVPPALRESYYMRLAILDGVATVDGEGVNSVISVRTETAIDSRCTTPAGEPDGGLLNETEPAYKTANRILNSLTCDVSTMAVTIDQNGTASGVIGVLDPLSVDAIQHAVDDGIDVQLDHSDL